MQKPQTYSREKVVKLILPHVFFVWFAIVTSHCVHPSSQVCVVGFSEVLVGGSGPDMHIHAQFEVLEKDDKTHGTFERVRTRNRTCLQLIQFHWKESEPGNCGHSSLAFASPSKMVIVRSSTAAKPSSPEIREASKPICTIHNVDTFAEALLSYHELLFTFKPNLKEIDLI